MKMSEQITLYNAASAVLARPSAPDTMSFGRAESTAATVASNQSRGLIQCIVLQERKVDHEGGH